jgi:hypothetical protein
LTTMYYNYRKVGTAGTHNLLQVGMSLIDFTFSIICTVKNVTSIISGGTVLIAIAKISPIMPESL